MKIFDLKPAVDEKTNSKRLGRGVGSGKGKTSGKGHKGQWARSGGGVRPGFEGGQMPLTRRLPKRGFTNIFKKIYATVNLSALEENFADGDVISASVLYEKGIIGKLEEYGLKILGEGTLTKKITVQADKFSASAKEKIEKAGGTAEVL